MSQASKSMRDALSHSLDALEMIAFNDGFEAALEGLEQLSDQLHNKKLLGDAEALRWAAKELRGENNA